MASTYTSSPQSDQLKSQLRLHLIVFIWGFTAILGDLITLQAISLVFYRIGISLLVLWPFVWIFRRGHSPPAKSRILLMLTGFLIALHWVTFFHAIKISNISITLACLSSGSLFGALFEPIFFKRKLRLYEVVLGLVVIVGISTIFAVETQYAWGIATALTSASLSALFSTINGLWVRNHKPTVISTYELTGGFLMLTVWLLIRGDLSVGQAMSISSSDWGYLFVLGTICTAYPFIEAVRVMKHLNPFTVLLTINLEPVYGIVLAYLIFGEKEQMSPAFYFGTLLILCAVMANGVIERYRRRAISRRKAQDSAT